MGIFDWIGHANWENYNPSEARKANESKIENKKGKENAMNLASGMKANQNHIDSGGEFWVYFSDAHVWYNPGTSEYSYDDPNRG